MRSSIRSACVVTIAVVTTSANCLAVVVAAAAENDNRAQTKATTPAQDDPCSLLTKEDAAAALGEAVGGPESKTSLPMGPGTTISSCEYSGSDLHKIHLNLISMSPDSAAMYRGMCAEKDNKGLAGFGDIACWYNDKHEELQVLKGKTVLSLELRRSGDPTEAIKGAMKKALSRLG
jgi:hypothetical protein